MHLIFQFFAQNCGTILVSLLLIFVVILAVISLLRKKKNGGCIVCNCECCSHSSCSKSQRENTKVF